jgi:3'5'-cyclic nucleotide phosphodiesterase
MESNSSPGKILCSQKTADLLIDAGKGAWLTLRPDAVNAKGKGLMQCYWINPPNSRDITSVQHRDTGTVVGSSHMIHTKTIGNGKEMDPQVMWISDMFCSILEEVVKHRVQLGQTQTLQADSTSNVSTTSETELLSSPWKEVSDVLPLMGRQDKGRKLKSTNVPTVTDAVKIQVSNYVAAIAARYRNNAFHNFDHASHVVMSTRKILSRVIKSGTAAGIAHGMTVDPLVHFAILFSALIHDVDHPGVSNGQLNKENDRLSVMYNYKSVAEQNSVSLAWELLMQEEFSGLRKALMPGIAELQLFRKLLVNCVMATDLFDQDLKKLRDGRWLKSFEDVPIGDNNVDDTDIESDNRRSTIVIEHIIQASDVSHTMQHWHIYQSWNRRLLEEMYFAYVAGRAEKNPLESWYDGELWFFDNYVIPLAKKLKTCGVFGVSCDELLNYANDNRKEWETKGREIIAQYAIELDEAMQDRNMNLPPRRFSTGVATTFDNIIDDVQVSV